MITMLILTTKFSWENKISNPFTRGETGGIYPVIASEWDENQEGRVPNRGHILTPVRYIPVYIHTDLVL